MRKIYMPIMALVVAVVLAFAISPAPANADVTVNRTDCWKDDGDAQFWEPDAWVCVTLVATLDGDGVGIKVPKVVLDCYPKSEFEDNPGPAVDGQRVSFWNGQGGVQWVKGDADSDIPGDCDRVYTPDINMPNTNSVTIEYKIEKVRFCCGRNDSDPAVDPKLTITNNQ